LIFEKVDFEKNEFKVDKIEKNLGKIEKKV